MFNLIWISSVYTRATNLVRDYGIATVGMSDNFHFTSTEINPKSTLDIEQGGVANMQTAVVHTVAVVSSLNIQTN